MGAAATVALVASCVALVAVTATIVAAVSLGRRTRELAEVRRKLRPRPSRWSATPGPSSTTLPPRWSGSETFSVAPRRFLRRSTRLRGSPTGHLPIPSSRPLRSGRA